METTIVYRGYFGIVEEKNGNYYSTGLYFFPEALQEVKGDEAGKSALQLCWRDTERAEGTCLCHLSSNLLGDTMVPNTEEDYILLFGYSIVYKEYNLTGFNHQKTLLICRHTGSAKFKVLHEED